MEKLLHERSRYKAKFDLDKIKRLLHFFNNPEKKLNVIHVAGTNGKGSTATKIAYALGCEYRVGLFTSPHIFSYRERIQVNGKTINKEEIKRGLEGILEAENVLGIRSSFFEITVVLGILYFVDKKVDFAVFEAGIGGLKDATNVFDSLVSVITTIGLDHTTLLGDTIEKIGIQKAGIIKSNKAVVLGPSASSLVIEDIANKKNNRIIRVDDSEYSFDLHNEEVAKMTLQYIKENFPLKRTSIEYGIKKRPRCRFEVIQKRGKTFVLDVAHNEDGFFYLFKMAMKKFPRSFFRVLLGMHKDKNVDKCAEVASLFACHIHVVDNENSRLFPKERLFSVCAKFTKNISYEENIKSSMKLATAEKNRGEILLVCGSFSIMRDVLEFIEMEF